MAKEIGYNPSSDTNKFWQNVASKPNINTGKPPARMYQVTDAGAGTYKPNPAAVNNANKISQS